MSSLLALMLVMTAPDAPLAAADRPAPQARSVATARARILRPIAINQRGKVVGDGEGYPARVTHQSQRRDGAIVVDTF